MVIFLIRLTDSHVSVSLIVCLVPFFNTELNRNFEKFPFFYFSGTYVTTATTLIRFFVAIYFNDSHLALIIY